MINTKKDYDYWDPARKGFVTNYPNFMQWKRMSAEQMRDKAPLNLYLHSPFCIQRCSYCYYKTINLRGSDKHARMDNYVNALCQEIELASQYYNLKERPVISVYFGGGTPSLLHEEQLQKVFETLHKNFTLLESAEITVEAEPVTLTQKKARALVELNVSRISMGVQSFDNQIIKESHRLDDERKALRAIEIAKETGAVINIDLMSGLASETAKTWRHSVSRALETGVQSITVYKTELYTNTDYYKGLRNNTITLPDDEEELDYMQYALEQLEEAQYVPWSFYTFTKHGENVHVHSPSIFRGDDYYAFGTSAFGRLNNWVFQNSNNEERYIKLLGEGQLPIQRGHHLTSLDQMIRDVVLTMKLVSLNLRDFQNKYGMKLESLCAPVLETLESENYITVSDDEIRLTRKGILHGDYSGKSMARHLMAMYE